MPEDAEPFSPELVLVCPELREIALARERAFPRAARRIEPVPQRPLQSSPRTVRRSVVPVIAVTLAAALAVGSYWAGYEGGVASTPREASEPTPPAVVLGVHQRPRPASERPVARSTGRADTPTKAATTATTSVPPASARQPRVVLSADGLYVTSLDGPDCPGVPKLPWLLVSDGRFAWEGELDGYLVRVDGRLAAGDRLSGTAAYRSQNCKRTITYNGRAVRAAR